jgi:hypothetical protein
MRLRVFLAILILAVSLLSPISFKTNISTDSYAAAIFTLDVCSASSHSLSINGEMPVVNECSCIIIQPAFVDFYMPLDYSLKLSPIEFQKEYPPEV